MKLLKIVLVAIGIVALLLGTDFRIQRWPLGTEILLMGGVFIVLSFFIKTKK